MPSEADRPIHKDSDAVVLTRGFSGTIGLAGSSAPTATFLAGCLAAVFLVLWPDYLPMVDAPNHLARLNIIAASNRSALRSMYDVVWVPIPNLGLDLAFLALKGFLSPNAVLRLCVLFSVVVILGSAYIIQTSVFGRLSWSAAFVPIFIFGYPWHMGLLNYLMGVSIVLAGIALFVHSGRSLGNARSVLLSAIGVLALVCHVAAFAAFMLLLSALYCAEELVAPNRAARHALLRKGLHLFLVFLPGLLLYLVCEKPSHNGGIYYTPARTSALVEKLVLPLFAADGTGTYADVQLLGSIVATIIFIAASSGLRIWRPAQPALVLMTAAIALLPSRIDYAMLIDSRLVLVLAVFGLSVTEIGSRLRNIRPTVAVTILTVLIGFRVETIFSVETQYDREVRDFRSATKAIENHPKVLVAVDTYTRHDCSQSAVDLGVAALHAHLGSFLTIDNEAFIQLIFAGRGMQPIRPRGEYAPISSPASVPVPVHILQLAGDPANASEVDALMTGTILDRFVLDWRHGFDDMLVLHRGCSRNPFPSELTPLIVGPFFTLYRIDKSHAS